MDHNEPVALVDPLAEATTGLAMRTLRVTDVTLHSWRRRGKIRARQTAAGRYLFDVREYLDRVGGQA